MSVECCLAVSRPYHPPCLTVRRATLVVVTVWAASCLIAASPPLAVSRFYGVNGVCMPLHIEHPYADGWQYSTAVFVGVNLTAVLVIGVSYALMCLSVRATRLDVGLDARSAQRRSVVGGPGGGGQGWGYDDRGPEGRAAGWGGEGEMARVWRRLFLIVFTNVLCWIPVVVVKLLAFTTIPISGLTSAAIIIFIILNIIIMVNINILL